MKVNIKPGKYILAVSGGADSMVLLDLLARKPDITLIAAHFNHGIRPDAAKDEALVRSRTEQLGLPLETGYGNLGNRVSEDAARKARYGFLYEVENRYAADAIVTAHHQDDLIETAIINMLRGTGYKGLVALQSNKQVIRPLLRYSKAGILNYGRRHNLEWREDASNSDNNYLRNYLRNKVIIHLSPEDKSEILKNIDKVANIDAELRPQIAKLSQNVNKRQIIDRAKFTSLPVSLGGELIAYWLRQQGQAGFDKKTISRINATLRTSRPDTAYQVGGNLRLKINKKTAHFIHSV